jgi:hypothetical protein
MMNGVLPMWLDPALTWLYAPMDWLYVYGPWPIGELVRWYANFWY